MADNIDDKFDTPPELQARLVSTGDIPDASLLAEHMRHLQREMHDGFESISRQLLPAINRIQDALEDIGVRLNRLEHDRDNDRKRLAAIEQELEKRAKRTKRRK
jgi:hypothetical protein